MRQRRSGSRELARLAGPVVGMLDGLYKRMHWWISLLLAAWLLSGITVVEADEVALVLRFGALRGRDTAQAVHPPGFLFAWPAPIDEVLRVKVQKVYEVEITELQAGGAGGKRALFTAKDTLDPTRSGYCLTGDNNIVMATLLAHYQIRDPVAYTLHELDPERTLRDVVTQVMVRSVGEVPVDPVLSDGRQALVATVSARTQARLDALNTGIQLVSLEFSKLGPPSQVEPAFNKVQSAFISSETTVKEAQGYREKQLPQARTEANSAIQTAQGDAAARLARARGDAGAFTALLAEYRRSPRVVRERLYLEGLEGPLAAAGRTRFIPPPPRGGYRDYRITLGSVAQ